MTPKEFKKTYWPDIAASCEETGLNPLFVAAQAALETGWGKSAIGHNLFGITATKKWRGAVKYVRTFEYFDDDKYTPLRGCRTGATNMSWIAPSEIIRLSGSV